MFEIVPQLSRFGIFPVTSLHVVPPSRVTCTRPSLVPAHNTLASIGDSPIANTTPAYSTPMLSGVNPPEMRCLDLSLRVRSGEISLQWLPPSFVMCTCWLPTYTTLWSCDDSVSGAVHTKRYLRLSAGQPIVDCGQTSTFCTR